MQEITKQELMLLIGNKPTILDIGSYDGSDAFEFAELGARVFCFEPVNFDKMKSHPNMVLFPYAVGASDKITIMYCSHHAQSNSLRKPKNHLELFPNVLYNKRESVEMVKLDTWHKNLNPRVPLPKIDLIWADVNGCEGDLIEGGQSVLEKTRYLFIESSDKELFEGQVKTDDLLKMLPDWELLGVYNHLGNFGNYLLKNGRF